ncbi:hypothetical protein C0991_012148, partial [Blastosporella zonata]
MARMHAAQLAAMAAQWDASLPLPQPQALVLHAFMHVRTVIKEVCISLYGVSSYVSYVRGLAHAVEALDYMRKAGYVHCDVSPGNVLWDPERSRGLLSDLEHARPYESLTRQGPKM